MGFSMQRSWQNGDTWFTALIFAAADGREISAGMEVIARLDEEGVAILGSYKDAVKVTVELSN